MDNDSKWWLCVCITVLLFCSIFMIIELFKARKEGKSFYSYLKEEDAHFGGVLSHIGSFFWVVSLLVGLVFWLHHLIF